VPATLTMGRDEPLVLDRDAPTGYHDGGLEGSQHVRQFKWVEWNLEKIDAHALSAEDVEAAFERVLSLRERKDGSYQMFAQAPSVRRIWVIWRYDQEGDEMADFFGDLSEVPIFVITA
jgi:hypothetical protein